MKTFLIDVSKCVGCYNCQIVCKDEHVGNDWSPYAKAQPDTGHFWMKVVEQVRGTVPKVKVSYTPTPCMHCNNAPCIGACKDDAIYRREDGLVLISAEKCSGCKDCLEACPYGVIYFNEELKLAQKCSGCAHLIDQGWAVPRCVDACPTGALMFGEEKELRAKMVNAEVLHPEYGCEPLVQYLHLPQRFIAGSLYDPAVEECLQGAQVSATSGGKTYRADSDIYGDFWFKDVPAGVYKMRIVIKGYQAQEMEVDVSEKDVNLGDLALQRERAPV